jgi:hypothetical protein
MNNPPAFPCHLDTPSEYDGMTLRDYFAAKAMQGLMHNYHPCDFLEHNGWIEDISMASYQLADAMLAARKEA